MWATRLWLVGDVHWGHRSAWVSFYGLWNTSFIYKANEIFFIGFRFHRVISWAIPIWWNSNQFLGKPFPWNLTKHLGPLLVVDVVRLIRLLHSQMTLGMFESALWSVCVRGCWERSGSVPLLNHADATAPRLPPVPSRWAHETPWNSQGWVVKFTFHGEVEWNQGTHFSLGSWPTQTHSVNFTEGSSEIFDWAE